jgi:hypothetical protein
VYIHAWQPVPIESSTSSVYEGAIWVPTIKSGDANRGRNGRWRALFRNEAMKQGWKEIFHEREQVRNLLQQETRRSRDRTSILTAQMLYKMMAIAGLSAVVLLNAALTLCEHRLLSSTEFVLILLFWALVSLITVIMVRSNMLTSFTRILQFGGFSSLLCFAALKIIQKQSPSDVARVSDLMLAIPLASAGFFSTLMLCSVGVFWILPFVPASYRSTIGSLLLDE